MTKEKETHLKTLRATRTEKEKRRQSLANTRRCVRKKITALQKRENKLENKRSQAIARYQRQRIPKVEYRNLVKGV